MPIENHNVYRQRKVIDLPYSYLTGAHKLTEGTPNTIGSATAAAAVAADVNSTGEMGLKMSTDGNAVLHDWLVPLDLDPAYEARIRLNWVTESTTSGHGALFTVTRKAYTRNTTALSSTVSTALDTALVADTVGSPGTAYKLNTTAPGVISAGSLTPGERQTLKITMTTKTGATDIWLRGLEIQYVPAISPTEGAGGPVADNTWT